MHFRKGRGDNVGTMSEKQRGEERRAKRTKHWLESECLILYPACCRCNLWLQVSSQRSSIFQTPWTHALNMHTFAFDHSTLFSFIKNEGNCLQDIWLFSSPKPRCDRQERRISGLCLPGAFNWPFLDGYMIVPLYLVETLEAVMCYLYPVAFWSLSNWRGNFFAHCLLSILPEWWKSGSGWAEMVFYHWLWPMTITVPHFLVYAYWWDLGGDVFVTLIP